jgi:hypothetical protein
LGLRTDEVELLPVLPYLPMALRGSSSESSAQARGDYNNLRTQPDMSVHFADKRHYVN